MPNWKKVIVSGSNAVLNNITASGHLTALDGGFTVNTATETELEVQGNISGSGELEVKYRKLNLTSTTANDYSGDVVFFGAAGSGFGAGKVCRFSAGTWVAANAATTLFRYQLLGIALGANINDGVLIKGFYTLSYSPGTVNQALYLTNSSSTPFSTSPPTTTGYISRVLGYLFDSDNRIYFNPSTDWIEISA